MAEQQRTFGEAVGLEPLVQTQRLPLDLVECVDGKLVCHEDVYTDCRDNPHSSEESQHNADVEIVTEILDGFGKWAEEYCTENADYADGYHHIVQECSHEWNDCVKEWLEDAYGDKYDDKIVEAICNNIDDWEAERNHGDYSGYSGDGCCLWGFKIGEHEEQVDVNAVDELKELHEQGRLDDVLDDVNCDVYVSRSKRRVKNEATGYYESVGRDTYNLYGNDHPTFEIYTSPGGGWDFVVSKERMEQLLADAIIEVARRLDK